MSTGENENRNNSGKNNGVRLKEQVIPENGMVEGEEPVLPKHGCKPSQDQVDKHRASGHVPYRNWCEECIEGQGKEDGHRTHGMDKRW